MKKLIIILLGLMAFPVFGQKDTSIVLEQEFNAVPISRDFEKRYKREYDRVKKIYPLALKAKELIEEFDAELADIDKKRKRKKYGRQAHQQLKDEFTYAIKELYTSEGVLLMKLINRETGKTVSEIVRQYRGNLTGGIYDAMGSLWDQDLDVKYDPKGKDWLTELVVQDIINGRVQFDPTVTRVTKEDYKEDRKAYKKSIREYRKANRRAKRSGS